jgi:hypothetical protein
MAKKVRKQIYIEEQQERKLRRIAESRGISQAEIIRNALERETAGASPSFGIDPLAWEQVLTILRALHRAGRKKKVPRSWKREELYKERVDRHGGRPD